VLKIRPVYLTPTACLALLAPWPQPVASQETGAAPGNDDQGQDAPADELESLKRQVAELEAGKALALERVDNLLDRVERLEMLLGQAQVSDGDAMALRGRYAPSAAQPIPADPSLPYYFSKQTADSSSEGVAGAGTDIAAADVEDRKAPAPTEAVVEVAEQRQGRFGKNIGLDLSLDYSHFSNARINLSGFLALDSIFLGKISIDQITSDIYSAEPTLNIGLTDRLFFNAGIPYLFRTSNFRSGGAGANASGLVEETVHYNGFGDMTAGASYRLLRESASRPDIVINARVKVPTGDNPYGVELREIETSEGNLTVPERLSTGSGVWGASVGVSALKTIDPMVVFGSVTYFRNFERGFGDIEEVPGEQPGRVDVGNAYQVGAGIAFALNEKSSISTSYTQRIVEQTRIRRDGQDWQKIIGSQANVGFVNLGATFSLNQNLSLISTIGIGLTEDSPDMAVSVRVPYRF
jgi:hypothetical protein